MPFTIPEDALIVETGLSKKAIRDLRGEKGVAWDHVANGQVAWSDDARSRLLATLKPKVETIDQPEVATVAVKRCPNQRLFLATIGKDTLIKVFTGGKSDLFRHPMKVLVRKGEADCWFWVGNPDNPAAGRRLPRRAGKW